MSTPAPSQEEYDAATERYVERLTDDQRAKLESGEYVVDPIHGYVPATPKRVAELREDAAAEVTQAPDTGTTPAPRPTFTPPASPAE